MTVKRIYPPELQEMLDNNPDNVWAVTLQGYPRQCENCFGVGSVFVQKVGSGPYQIPKGRGSIFLDENSGRKPGWYAAELISKPCPVCSGDMRDEWLTDNCGLKGMELEVTLSDFKQDGIFANKAEARKAAAGLLAQGIKPSGFVTFYGGYGVGKSMLMMAIVNGFRLQGVYSTYTTLADLLARVRSRFGETRGMDAEAVIDSYRQHRVLAIDELDKVNLTSWTKETIARLLDARYKERESLLTVMAMNTAPDDLPAELGYLRSRFSGGVVLEVGGPDMRPGQGMKAQKELVDWTV